MIVTIQHRDGRRAVLTPRQLQLVPNLLRFKKRDEIDAAVADACAKHGCPIDWEAQAVPDGAP